MRELALRKRIEITMVDCNLEVAWVTCPVRWDWCESRSFYTKEATDWCQVDCQYCRISFSPWILNVEDALQLDPLIIIMLFYHQQLCYSSGFPFFDHGLSSAISNVRFISLIRNKDINFIPFSTRYGNPTISITSRPYNPWHFPQYPQDEYSLH